MSREKKVIKENIRLHGKEAERYEKSKLEIFNEREQDRIESILGEATGHIVSEGPGIRALDIGCGTGNILEKLTDKCDEVIGLDLSKDMLSVASTIFQKGENPFLVQGRAGKLPFNDNTFDLITAYSLFHHLPYFSNPISEIARVLKGGGVLYVDHEPIERERLSVKLYIKFCDFLNGDSSGGLPPYEEEDGMDRKFCDYHLHHGDSNGGIPAKQVLKLCRENDIEVLSSRRYLAYGSPNRNFLHPILKHFINSEWILIGRKR